MKTSDQLQAEAAQHTQDAAESFERCDTDGFMSQWASGMMAEEKRLQASIQDNGGKAEFLALFDLNGNLVPAKYIETRYGWAWGILADTDPDSRFIGWFNPSRASTAKRALANDRKKGYQVGYALAPAKAKLQGGNITSVRAMPYRTDGGFSENAEITDNPAVNGTDSRWYAIIDQFN